MRSGRIDMKREIRELRNLVVIKFDRHPAVSKLYNLYLFIFKPKFMITNNTKTNFNIIMHFIFFPFHFYLIPRLLIY